MYIEIDKTIQSAIFARRQPATQGPFNNYITLFCELFDSSPFFHNLPHMFHPWEKYVISIPLQNA